MPDPRIKLMDDLIEGVDNIDGSPIHVDDNDAHDLWIHTQAQVRAWLVEERDVLLRLINLERRPLG